VWPGVFGCCVSSMRRAVWPLMTRRGPHLTPLPAAYGERPLAALSDQRAQARGHQQAAAPRRRRAAGGAASSCRSEGVGRWVGWAREAQEGPLTANAGLRCCGCLQRAEGPTAVAPACPVPALPCVAGCCRQGSAACISATGLGAGGGQAGGERLTLRPDSAAVPGVLLQRPGAPGADLDERVGNGRVRMLPRAAGQLLSVRAVQGGCAWQRAEPPRSAPQILEETLLSPATHLPPGEALEPLSRSSLAARPSRQLGGGEGGAMGVKFAEGAAQVS
jgi:hypothetical protein